MQTQPRQLIYLLLLAVGLTGIFVGVHLLHIREPAAPAQPVTTAEISAAKGSPATVALPHDWIAAGIDAEAVTYSLQFTAPRDAADWALYLPSVDMATAVSLNGRRLQEDIGSERPLPRYWNRPLWLQIPDGLLLTGQNRLEIRLLSEPAGRGLLGKVWVGPASAMRPVYQQRHFVKITLIQIISIVSTAICLFMLVLWWFRREEPMYFWFAVGGFIWMLHNLNLYVVDIPVPARLWDWFWFLTLGGFVWAILPFANRFLARQDPWVERGSFLVLFALAGWMLALPHDRLYHFGFRIWDSVIYAIGLYISWFMVKALWNNSRMELLLLVMSGVSILVLASHDYLVVNGRLPRTEGLYIQFAAPLILIVFTWMLVRRFAGAMRAAEVLNRELERRVDEKVAEVRTAYDRLGAMERDKALAEERERIMRDMHDGVGGHLVATLSMLQRGQTDPAKIRSKLQQAIQEMRLMIDSMETGPEDLAAVLAMLRNRLAEPVAQAGIKLDWQVTDTPPIPEFGPDAALQVMRIMQEAITNVLRHARATRLRIATRCEQGRVLIEVEDNGCGLPADVDTAHQGHGLDNMSYRASRIGAKLEITAADPGTRLQLSLPAIPHL